MEALPRSPGSRRRLLLAGFAALGLAFAATTSFWSFTSSLILDDYFVCAATGDVGAVWDVYWELTGPYRPLTYPVTALRALTCDVFVIHKILGFGLHLTCAWLLYLLARRLRLGVAPAVAAVAVFFFSPFVLEGMAWPASVYGYPLALAFLIGAALLLLRPDPRVGWASVLALLAVVTNEQTLPIVVLLPLVTTGAWRERLLRWVRIVAPVVVYVAAIGLTASIGGLERSGSFGPRGLVYLLGNTGEFLTQVAGVFPPGANWRLFQAGPGLAPALALVAATAAVGAFLLVDRGEGAEKRSPVGGALAVAAGGAVAVLALLAPIYAQEVPWLSPRHLYMPYAAFALAVGGVFEAAVRLRPQVRYAVFAVPILIVALVGDGLHRDAGDYRTTFEAEGVLADAISAELATGSYERVVLVDPPWALAPETPLLGEHIVHAFVVGWAAPYATEVLGGLESPPGVTVVAPMVVGPGTLCDDGGTIVVDGVAGLDPERTLVFDVDAVDRVATLELASGETIELADDGLIHQVPACA